MKIRIYATPAVKGLIFTKRGEMWEFPGWFAIHVLDRQIDQAAIQYINHLELEAFTQTPVKVVL